MLAGNTLAHARQAHAVCSLNMHRGVTSSYCPSVIRGFCTDPCVAQAAQTLLLKFRAVIWDACATVAVAVKLKAVAAGDATNAVCGWV